MAYQHVFDPKKKRTMGANYTANKSRRQVTHSHAVHRFGWRIKGAFEKNCCYSTCSENHACLRSLSSHAPEYESKSQCKFPLARHITTLSYPLFLQIIVNLGWLEHAWNGTSLLTNHFLSLSRFLFRLLTKESRIVFDAKFLELNQKVS